jgi:hypothetical protein
VRGASYQKESGINSFGLDALIHDPPYLSNYSVRWPVEQMIVKDLRMFGLITVESGRPRRFSDDETVHSFQLTTLGVHIFELALSPHRKG